MLSYNTILCSCPYSLCWAKDFVFSVWHLLSWNWGKSWIMAQILCDPEVRGIHNHCYRSVELKSETLQLTSRLMPLAYSHYLYMKSLWFTSLPTTGSFLRSQDTFTHYNLILQQSWNSGELWAMSVKITLNLYVNIWDTLPMSLYLEDLCFLTFWEAISNSYAFFFLLEVDFFY